MTTRHLLQILAPRTGDHLLEVGPGVGTDSVPVAAALLPDGVLNVLDIQPCMLRTVRDRARSAGLANIRLLQGDAAYLPFRDHVFDAAFMIGTLGEIAEGDRALKELGRVLKPAGHLVIGELFVDPDFVPLRRLKERTRQAGFTFHSKTRNTLVVPRALRFARS
jgi:ubiquinone/menaquinone biosynthesis C-methylase UbiE